MQLRFYLQTFETRMALLKPFLAFFWKWFHWFALQVTNSSAFKMAPPGPWNSISSAESLLAVSKFVKIFKVQKILENQVATVDYHWRSLKRNFAWLLGKEKKTWKVCSTLRKKSDKAGSRNHDKFLAPSKHASSPAVLPSGTLTKIWLGPRCT